MGEPGATAETPVEWEVDASDVRLEVKLTFSGPLIITDVKFTSTSGLSALSRGSTANSSGSLCWLLCGSGGEKEEIVLLQGRATLLCGCMEG